MTAVQVFVSVFVPIVLIGGAGYAIGRARIVEQTQPLSRLCVSVLLPALAFTAMARSDLGGRELGILVAFAWIIAGLQALVGRLAASRLTLDPLTFGAVLLSSVTVNAGNYGIPLNQFAFGAQAVSRAAVYYLATLVVTYVGGAVVGAGGGGFQHAAHRIFRLPVVYGGWLEWRSTREAPRCPSP